MSDEKFGKVETGDELEQAIQEAADSIPDEEEEGEEESSLEGAAEVTEEEIKNAAQAGQLRTEQGK